MSLFLDQELISFHLVIVVVLLHLQLFLYLLMSYIMQKCCDTFQRCSVETSFSDISINL